MAKGELTSYDAAEVTISLAGQPLDSGLTDGEFLGIEAASEDWQTKVGADGSVVRYKTNDRRATITLTLMQTSSGNDLLSQLREADLTANNGAGVGAFIARDLGGRTVARAQAAWVKKAPKISRGKEAGEVAWELECAALEITVGGSTRFGT